MHWVDVVSTDSEHHGNEYYYLYNLVCNMHHAKLTFSIEVLKVWQYGQLLLPAEGT